MGKLVHIDKDRVISANRKLEKLLADDKEWQEQLQRLEKEAEEEKKRRDEEYARRGKQEGRAD